MGRNDSNGLVIVTLLIAIISVGFSLGMFFGLIPIQSDGDNDGDNVNSINRMMYTSREDDFTLGDQSYLEVPDFSINIIVEEGESVYIVFNGQWSMTANDYGHAAVQIAIDGAEIVSTRRQSASSFSSIFSQLYAISTQHVAIGLSAGAHIITIETQSTEGGVDAAIMRDMNLFAYTFS